MHRRFCDIVFAPFLHMRLVHCANVDSFATVVGGGYNTAKGNFSLALGHSAFASHDYSAVLNVNPRAQLCSDSNSGPNTVTICAVGGFFVNGELVSGQSQSPAIVAALIGAYVLLAVVGAVLVVLVLAVRQGKATQAGSLSEPLAVVDR
jgi:hypothetical protein